METLPKSEVGARSRKEVGSFFWGISNSLPHSIRASLGLVPVAFFSFPQDSALIDLQLRACTEPAPMNSLHLPLAFKPD